MSGPKWTPAQQAAIADRGGALLVSAAAGAPSSQFSVFTVILAIFLFCNSLFFGVLIFLYFAHGNKFAFPERKRRRI